MADPTWEHGDVIFDVVPTQIGKMHGGLSAAPSLLYEQYLTPLGVAVAPALTWPSGEGLGDGLGAGLGAGLVFAVTGWIPPKLYFAPLTALMCFLVLLTCFPSMDAALRTNTQTFANLFADDHCNH